MNPRASINYGTILVLIMAVLSLGAAIAYALVRDWKRAAYWFLVMLLDIVLTL